MTDRPIATALGDLTSSEWHSVADRVRQGGLNVWVWHLSAADQAVLTQARDIGGTMATMQERVGEGGMRLLARLLPVKLGRMHAPGGLRSVAERGPAPLAAHARPESVPVPQGPVLAHVPRSPKAWHPGDDLARAKLRLAAAGSALGMGGETQAIQLEVAP